MIERTMALERPDGTRALFPFCKHGGAVRWVEPWALLEVQHGQNPEHRQRFSAQLIMESNGAAVTAWFDELHALEAGE